MKRDTINFITLIKENFNWGDLRLQDSRQADMVLKKELRGLHLDTEAAKETVPHTLGIV